MAENKYCIRCGSMYFKKDEGAYICFLSKCAVFPLDSCEYFKENKPFGTAPLNPLVIRNESWKNMPDDVLFGKEDWRFSSKSLEICKVVSPEEVILYDIPPFIKELFQFYFDKGVETIRKSFKEILFG